MQPLIVKKAITLAPIHDQKQKYCIFEHKYSSFSMSKMVWDIF